MVDMSGKMKAVLVLIIGAIVITAILAGLRTTALKNAYDNTKAFSVTDTAGVVHNVSESGVSGDTIALIYALFIGLVWLFALVGILFSLVSFRG